jgi:hypothetical protein
VLMVAFGLEALLGIQALTAFLPVAVSYDATVWVMTFLRALVTLGQGMTVMMLSRRAAPASPFGRTVVLASAVLLTLEVGARLAPSNLAPGTREPVLAAYWVYAVLVVLILKPRVLGNRVF